MIRATSTGTCYMCKRKDEELINCDYCRHNWHCIQCGLVCVECGFEFCRDCIQDKNLSPECFNHEPYGDKTSTIIVKKRKTIIYPPLLRYLPINTSRRW